MSGSAPQTSETLDLTNSTHVRLRVETGAVSLGNYLAEQNSQAQADVLWGFAASMHGLDDLAWRRQCAYIRDAWNNSQRVIVEEFLRELLSEAS